MKENEIITGVTTNSITDNSINIIVKQSLQKTIVIKNSGATNSIKYKIFGYVTKNSKIAIPIKQEDELRPGDIYKQFLYQGQYDHAIVSLQNYVADTPSTYILEANVL